MCVIVQAPFAFNAGTVVNTEESAAYAIPKAAEASPSSLQKGLG